METISIMANQELGHIGEIKERKYRKNERGLESLERKMLASAKMKSLLKKMSVFYGVQFKTPNFVPVYVSKRLRSYAGLHYSDKIVIEYHSTKDQKLLWHEIMHSVVHDNWNLLWDEYRNQGKSQPSYRSFEKQVFRFGTNDGSHGSHNWKLTCDCGMWVKSVNKKNMWICSRCNVRLISKSEYGKLKKIASIGSTTITFDINKYKPWKSNERIGGS